jgi:ankyrin repeat protein
MDQDITDLIKTGDNRQLEQKVRENPSIADIITEYGISLLQYAVYCRNIEAVDLIKKHKKQELNIFEAVSVGDTLTSNQLLVKNPNLLNSYSADGFTLLGLASYFGHYSLVKLLIEKGANPNIPSNNQFKVAPIHSACSISNYEIAKLLIKNGANINSRQQQGYSPLHSTAHNGNVELSKLLIESGADVNAKADDGKTPLAMALEKGFKETSDLLQSYGGRL